jgi:WD40 repeat protein
MGKPFLSRHYLGENPACLASIPFAPPGVSDDNGITVAHSLVAIGAWAEDEQVRRWSGTSSEALCLGMLQCISLNIPQPTTLCVYQEHHVSIFDLAVPLRGDDVAGPPSVSRLASFQHPGAVTGIAAAELGGGSVVVTASSSNGTVSRLRLHVPTAPGSRPEGVRLQPGDFEGALLMPWLTAAVGRGGPLSSLDISADRREVLVAAADGGVALAGLDVSKAAPFCSSEGLAGTTAARWASGHVFLTCTLQGALYAWDTRQGGREPALRAAAAAARTKGFCGTGGPPPAPLLSLAAHPALQHSCATGDSRGAVSLWDLRSGGAGPASIADTGAAVADLHFDGGNAGAASRLLYCTAGGDVGVVMGGGSGGEKLVTRSLYREPSAGLVGLAASSSSGASHLVAATDHEGLVFMANA